MSSPHLSTWETAQASPQDTSVPTVQGALTRYQCFLTACSNQRPLWFLSEPVIHIITQPPARCSLAPSCSRSCTTAPVCLDGPCSSLESDIAIITSSCTPPHANHATCLLCQPLRPQQVCLKTVELLRSCAGVGLPSFQECLSQTAGAFHRDHQVHTLPSECSTSGSPIDCHTLPVALVSRRCSWEKEYAHEVLDVPPLGYCQLTTGTSRLDSQRLLQRPKATYTSVSSVLQDFAFAPDWFSGSLPKVSVAASLRSTSDAHLSRISKRSHRVNRMRRPTIVPAASPSASTLPQRSQQRRRMLLHLCQDLYEVERSRGVGLVSVERQAPVS